jgi:putative FmdB family regulatory protein
VPIYDYLCSNCGERTEVIHGISAPGPRFCPVCGAEGTLRKAFVVPSVHFKGTGWAKKDRSTASTKARAKSESGAETGAAKTGPSGGEASPSTGSTSTTPSGSSSSDATSSGGSSSGSSSASSDAAAG